MERHDLLFKLLTSQRVEVTFFDAKPTSDIGDVISESLDDSNDQPMHKRCPRPK